MPQGVVRYWQWAGKRRFSWTIIAMVLSAREAMSLAPPLPVKRVRGPLPSSETPAA